MKRNISIQLKAILLLIVFSMNTVIGFACTIGIDMGFNTSHLEEATEVSVHVHSDGKKHEHHNEGGKHHDEDKDHHKTKDAKDNCCNEKVMKFNDVDKSVPASSNMIHPVFYTAFLASYYNVIKILHSDVVKDIKPFVRSHHPPISDIRIAIRSFQI
ncbi:MAG: hypothetical protein ABIO32_01160 [Ferruginibacter sp.]